MSKRKDEDSPSAHPPITTKRRRPAPGFRVAHNRDSEPQDATSSMSSTTTHTQQRLRPGFRAARSQEQENTTPCTSSLTTNSRITTLVLGANRHLKAKHKDHCGRTNVQDRAGSLVVCHRTTKIKIKRKRVKGNKGEIKKST